MTTVNPFPYTQPVPAAQVIDREREADAVLRWAGDAINVRLAAPRRYGKTSLLYKVIADAHAIGGWVGVYVDFFGVISVADVGARIERSYAEQLSGRVARWFDGVRRTLKPNVRVGLPGVSVGADIEVPDAGLLERLDLPRRIAERTGLRVLVVFDEFQEVLTARDDIDAVIRSVIQHHADSASYVFAGSDIGMLEALFGDPRRAFYAQARPLGLEPLPLDAVAEHLTDVFEATGRDIGRALGPTLDVCLGHPQRTMLVASHLWEATGVGEAADEETFSTALEAALLEVGDELRGTWATLSVAERRTLTRIAADDGALYARSDSGGPRGSVRYAVGALTRRGLVTADDGRHTRHRIVDPLLARWVNAGRPG